MFELKEHIKGVHQKIFLRISSLNIGRGIFKKEELLVNTISEQNCDICSVSEADIEDFDEQKPFSIEGFNTYFPLQRMGSNRKRLLCFVKIGIEVKQRNDLMSELLSNVWLEINGKNHSEFYLITNVNITFYRIISYDTVNTNTTQMYQNKSL